MKIYALTLLLALCLGKSDSAESPGDNPLDWLRNSVPGEPGTDYPIMATTQETSFTCDGLVFGGYYADTETDCQQYSVCLRDAVDIDSLSPVSFLCPNGTIFNQQLFNCDWWFNVDCSSSLSLYGLAEGAFGTSGAGTPGDVGSCPAPFPLSPDECEGAVSTCWSPGQRDTDCPNYGLCCFDGCADTCADQPQVQAAALASPVIVTTPGYSYEEPEVTLPVRPVPVTTQAPITTQPPVTLPPALYGPPQRARTGRRLRRKQGRRVQNTRPVVFV